MPKDDLSGEFVLNQQDKKPAAPEAIGQKNKVHLLSNLVLNPDNITFETQDEGEEIFLLVRRDLITNVPWIIAALILIFIPLIINSLSSLFAPFFSFSPQTQLIGVLFYYLVVLGFIIVQFALWYFNIGLVTSKRIVDFDVSGILAKEVSETKLNLIEDVTYTQVGSVRTVFNYGDVFMQTAGSLPNFEFDRAPEPARIVSIIGELIGR